MKAFNGLLQKLLIIALTVGLLSACGGKEERKAKYMEKGKAYLAEENYKKAEIEFKNVLQIDPKDAEGFMYAGLVNERQQKLSGAFPNYKKAVELDPEYTEPRVRLASIYLDQASFLTMQKQTDAAASATALAHEQVTEIRKLAPDDLSGLALEAVLWLREGNTEKAQAQLEKVISQDKTQAVAVKILSELYSQNNRFGDAESMLLDAAAASETPEQYQLRLVRLYILHDQRDKAEKMLGEVIKNNQDDAAPRIALAKLLLESMQVDRAEKVMRDFVVEDPENVERHILLSEFLVGNRNLEAAIQDLESVVGEHDDLTDLKFRLVSLYKANNDQGSTESLLNKIMDEQGVEPAGLRARVQLAQLLASRGDDADRVDSLIKEVLSENPRDNAALLLKGKRAGQEKDYVDAINSFRSALRDQPNSTEILRLLAAAHYANGEPELARDMLMRAVSVEPNNDQLRLRVAAQLAREKDIDGALEQVDAVLERDVDNESALSVKFDVLTLKGDAEGMLEIARKLQKLAPDKEDGYIREARLRYAQKEYEDALKVVDALLGKKPDSLAGLLTKADVLAAQEKYSEAIIVVEQIRELRPESAEAYFRLGNLQKNLGENDKAISNYEIALKNAPGSGKVLKALIAQWVEQGQMDKASKRLQEVLEQDPAPSNTNQLLGEVYVANKDLDKAVQAFESQIQVTPDSDVAYSQWAQVKAAQGDFDGATAAYEQGLKILPDNPRLLIGLAGVYERRKDFEAAILVYEKLLGLQPGNAIATNNLASLLSDHRTDAKSIDKAVEMAAVLEKTNQPAFQDTAGWIYYRKGDYEKAVVILEKVVEKAPEVPVFQYHLGMTYFRLGDKESASKYLAMATEGEVTYEGAEEARATLDKL